MVISKKLYPMIPCLELSGFEGARVNYAEHIFRRSNTDFPAIIFKSETSEVQEITWEELEKEK